MRKKAFENVPYMVNLKEKTLMTITSMKKYMTNNKMILVKSNYIYKELAFRICMALSFLYAEKKHALLWREGDIRKKIRIIFFYNFCRKENLKNVRKKFPS